MCTRRPDDLANSFPKVLLVCLWCLLMILAQQTQCDSKASWQCTMGTVFRWEGRYSHGHNVRGSYKLPKMVKAENFGHVSWFRENQQPAWPEAQPLLDWVWVLDFPWPHLRLGCRGGSQAELGLLNACASAIRDPLSLLPELALSLPVFRSVTLPQPTMLMCAWEKKMKLKWCFRNSFIM